MLGFSEIVDFQVLLALAKMNEQQRQEKEIENFLDNLEMERAE